MRRGTPLQLQVSTDSKHDSISTSGNIRVTASQVRGEVAKLRGKQEEFDENFVINIEFGMKSEMKLYTLDDSS